LRYLRLFEYVVQLWTVESGSHWSVLSAVSPEQQDYKLSEIRKRADVENGGDLGRRQVTWVQLPWPWLSRSICEPPRGPIAVRPFQKW
jgi:hypothetical protein